MDIRTEERYDDDFNQCNLFIMKRSGERVPFNESKIVRAIEKANAEVTIPLEKMSAEKIAIFSALIFSRGIVTSAFAFSIALTILLSLNGTLSPERFMMNKLH